MFAIVMIMVVHAGGDGDSFSNGGTLMGSSHDS